MERDFIISAFRSVRRRLLSRRTDDDEDALQEAFCRLWTRRREFSSQGEAEGFLTVAARNVSIDHNRRRQAHPETDIETLGRHPSSEEESDSRSELFVEINRLIDKHLSERDREILRRHDRDGWDFEEIADHFGITQANARMILSRSHIYLGLGFDWRNYKATADSRWLQPDGDGGVEWEKAPEGTLVRATQLKVFSLQLPLMYTWRIPNTYLKWRMGPILNFNTYSSIKGIYDDPAGNRCEYFTKDFDRRLFTVDFFASLSYQNVLGVYVRYSPMKVLNDASPINFSPLSIGVTIGL